MQNNIDRTRLLQIWSKEKHSFQNLKVRKLTFISRLRIFLLHQSYFVIAKMLTFLGLHVYCVRLLDGGSAEPKYMAGAVAQQHSIFVGFVLCGWVNKTNTLRSQ